MQKFVTGAAVAGVVGVGLFDGATVEWVRVFAGLGAGSWIHGVGLAATIGLGAWTYRAWSR